MTRGAREGAVDYHPALREMTLDPATLKRRGAAKWRINRAPFVGTTLADFRARELVCRARVK